MSLVALRDKVGEGKTYKSHPEKQGAKVTTSVTERETMKDRWSQEGGNRREGRREREREYELGNKSERLAKRELPCNFCILQ